MQKQLQQLIEFHKAFNLHYKEKPDPYDNSIEEIKNTTIRYNLMKEEIREWYSAASCNSDISERAKELADILYTVLGTVISEGLQDHIEKVFDLVHESNMSKLDDNGLPTFNAAGKVLKGLNYKEPDLSFLENM